MGVNHAEIGAMVLERFDIPKDICEAVRFHDVESGEITKDSHWRLKSIAREATHIVDNFSLPEKMTPSEIPALLRGTISEGKMMYQVSVRAEMRSQGYDELFPTLLEEASSLVSKGLKEHLSERPARMTTGLTSDPA